MLFICRNQVLIMDFESVLFHLKGMANLMITMFYMKDLININLDTS